MAILKFKSYRGRNVSEGQEVLVYRNLHNGLWSIKSAKKPHHVLGHAEAVVLEDCKMIVSEIGRQKVLATKNKHIHAWIRGKFTGEVNLDNYDKYSAEQITYNPYKYDSFVNVDDERAVLEAKVVYLANSKRVYAIEEGK